MSEQEKHTTVETTQATQVVHIVDPHSKAVQSLVLGILSFFIPLANIILAILAIIFGKRALNIIKEHGGDGKGLATAGYWLGIINLGFTVLGILAFILFSFAIVSSVSH
jgi:Domain of unknown function (DUF4190)